MDTLTEKWPRNARKLALALACRYMRIIEEWGSGIPRIQRMLAEAGLKPLEIIDNGINLQFRIWRSARDSGTEKTRANLIRRIGPDKGGHWEVVK